MRAYDDEESFLSTMEELVSAVSDGALAIPSDMWKSYLLASLLLEEILKGGVLSAKDSPAPLDADLDEEKIFH